MTINPLDSMGTEDLGYMTEEDRKRLMNASDAPIAVPSESTETSSKEETQEPIEEDVQPEDSAKAPSTHEQRLEQERQWRAEGIPAFQRFTKGVAQDFAGTKGGWTRPQDYAAAAGAGLIDFGIGLLNKIPKKNLPGIDNPFHNENNKIPSLPAYEDQGLQAVRDISSIVIPTIYLTRFTRGKAIALDKKVGWSLGKDKFVRWMSRVGLAAGSGAIVDEIAPVQERDHNLGGFLKESWPTTWSWYPQSWATLDSDSAEIKRRKNRDEGIGIGFFSDLGVSIGRLFKAKQGVKEATRWVPKNETARHWLDKKNQPVKLSDDPQLNDILVSAKNRDDALTELGQSKVNDPNINTDIPTKGVHDLMDYTENGVRSEDSGGVVAAGIDQVKIVKNIDTRYGRIGNFISPKNLQELITGKQNPVKFFQDLGKTLKETKVDYTGGNGRLATHTESLREAEHLGAALYNTDLDGMKNLLRPLSTVDPSTGLRKLSGKAYKGVMNAIKRYSDDFINLDKARAEGLAATSLAGQVSDMAEGARLMDGTLAVESSYDQILDRLEFLMNLQGQTAFTRQKANSFGSIINNLAKKNSTLNVNDTVKAIDSERNTTLQALENIANGSKQTIETLRQVKAERPQLLSPLMLAYEVTDGKIDSITKLNNYVRNSTGTISKAFFDARAEMPSAWTQGVWANIYNSVLSAVGTPLKAALSNTVLMIERPLTTYAGAIIQGDLSTLKRAHYMYNVGFAETFQRSLAHMNQIFKRASVDPNSVGYIMRDDIARKNAGQIDVMRTFSDAAEAEGNYGPSIFTNHVETLNDLSEHPVLRFSANAMSGFDGFTRSWIGNVEARARAYDKLMTGGGAVTEKRVRAMARNVYGQMFDETGMITDNAVEYASREIAMNLDNSLVSSLNEIVRTVPILKPFLMFPKTSTNMLKFAGSHNPVGAFVNDFNAFKLPFKDMPITDSKRLLTERGVRVTGENIEAAYDTIRAELKGRKALGTTFVTGAALLFTQDRITGNGIFDKTRQRARRELGWKPKSIKGLDGKYYSYENLGPLTDWLALTSDILDNAFTLDSPTTEILLQKAAFILAGNLTDKTFTAGLEPLGDVLSGNTAAMSRWAGTFGSAAVPLSGFRNEFARLITPQLKELEQELTQIVANRNPILKEQLPDLYDWMDGSKVGEPMNFFTRVWNTYSPLWKVSDSISPEKQFLIDIEFDGRPSLRTNGKGVEYTPEQRSEITRLMGEDGYFAKEVKRIMRSTTAKQFRKEWKAASDQGVYFDRSKFNNLHLQLNRALIQARRAAEARTTFYNEIQQQQFINREIDHATKQGNVQRILDLQRN